MTILLIWMLGYPLVAAGTTLMRHPVESLDTSALRRLDAAHGAIWLAGTILFVTLHLMSYA